jgi:DNA-binding beta-propeller fold protein YncE
VVGAATPESGRPPGTTGGTGGGGGGTTTITSTVHTALYAATITNPDPVFGFAVDATSGALSALASSPYPADQTPTEAHSVAVAPSGFLFATDTLNHVILEYKIDSSTADLTLLSTLPAVPSGDCPNELVVSPSGDFLYATDSCNQDVLGYAINTTTGATTPLSSSPFSVTSQFPLPSPALGRLTEDPGNKYLYVVDQNGNVLEIALASGGTMSPIGLAPSTEPTSPRPTA